MLRYRPSSERSGRPSVLTSSIGQFAPSRGQLLTIKGKQVVPTLQEPAEFEKRHETDDDPYRHADMRERVSCYLLKPVTKALLYMPERIVSRRQNEPFSAKGSLPSACHNGVHKSSSPCVRGFLLDQF
jgi:hypothetical protein